MLKKIPGNVQKDSGEFSRRFRGMFKKNPGNVRKDSGEYSKKFRGMFEKIPGNLNLDSFCEILLIFYHTLQLNCVKTKEYFLCYYLLITNLSPMLKYCLSSTFLLSLLFLLSMKGCNYCAQVQRYQKTLNNPQFRGLKNTQIRNHQLET